MTRTVTPNAIPNPNPTTRRSSRSSLAVRKQDAPPVPRGICALGGSQRTAPRSGGSQRTATETMATRRPMETRRAWANPNPIPVPILNPNPYSNPNPNPDPNPNQADRAAANADAEARLLAGSIGPPRRRPILTDLKGAKPMPPCMLFKVAASMLFSKVDLEL